MNRDVIEIFTEALRAVDPYAAVGKHVDRIRAICRDGGLRKIFVVNFGKAAYPMAHALADALPDRIVRGVVITKYGHVSGEPLPATFEIYEAGHPVPDDQGVAGAVRVIHLLEEADRESLVVFLVSGLALAAVLAEGMATGMEEMMLHAGLYDDNPRAREVVWIMLAQRDARGLTGSLYAHANEMTMKQAADFHVEWTPRGWMRPDLDLLAFEQQLYLRQPGYGTSYITGKYLLERLLQERSRQLGEEFTLYRFFEEGNATGLIPVALIRWQLTAKDDEIGALQRSD